MYAAFFFFSRHIFPKMTIHYPLEEVLRHCTVISILKLIT